MTISTAFRSCKINSAHRINRNCRMRAGKHTPKMDKRNSLHNQRSEFRGLVLACGLFVKPFQDELTMAAPLAYGYAAHSQIQRKFRATAAFAAFLLCGARHRFGCAAGCLLQLLLIDFHIRNIHISSPQFNYIIIDLCNVNFPKRTQEIRPSPGMDSSA